MGRPKNPLLVSLGRRIRARREAKKWSQDEAAARAGLDRSYYSAIERGERNVSVLRLADIAKALGVTVHSLFKRRRKSKK